MSSVTGSGTMRASAPAFMTAQSTAFIPRGSENFGSGAVGGDRRADELFGREQSRKFREDIRAGDMTREQLGEMMRAVIGDDGTTYYN
jgi:hypothetical protein